MSLPRNANLLGYAGLLPQAACLVAVVLGGPFAWTAKALALGYASLIFSFLGGVWWGIALTHDEEMPAWVLPVSVAPALVSLCLWMAWTVGWAWPKPELWVVGLCLIASPFVDRAIPVRPAGWLRLRSRLSSALGGMTIVIAMIA